MTSPMAMFVTSSYRTVSLTVRCGWLQVDRLYGKTHSASMRTIKWKPALKYFSRYFTWRIPHEAFCTPRNAKASDSLKPELHYLSFRLQQSACWLKGTGASCLSIWSWASYRQKHQPSICSVGVLPPLPPSVGRCGIWRRRRPEKSPWDPASPDLGETTEQAGWGWWYASCDRCTEIRKKVVHRASVSSAKPEAIDQRGRLKHDVPIRGTWQTYRLEERSPTPVICRDESIVCRCCGSLRSQENWERMDRWGCEHLLLIWPASGTSWRSGCGRLTPVVTDHTCQRVYHETENLPFSWCYFTGLSICSDCGNWILRERNVPRPVPDGGIDSCLKGHFGDFALGDFDDWQRWLWSRDGSSSRLLDLRQVGCSG